jgi:hypothetical protein
VHPFRELLLHRIKAKDGAMVSYQTKQLLNHFRFISLRRLTITQEFA